MVVQPGLCRTWWETPKTGFLRTRLNYSFGRFIQNGEPTKPEQKLESRNSLPTTVVCSKPRPSPTITLHGACSRSKLFVTLMVFSEKASFKNKNQKTTKMHAKILSRQRVEKSYVKYSLFKTLAEKISSCELKSYSSWNTTLGGQKYAVPALMKLGPEYHMSVNYRQHNLFAKR